MFGDEIDPDVIDELMAAADTDGNGDVDIDEFKTIMREGHNKFGGITRAMLTLRVRTDGTRPHALHFFPSLLFPSRRSPAEKPQTHHCLPGGGAYALSYGALLCAARVGNDRRKIDAVDAAQCERGDRGGVRAAAAARAQRVVLLRAQLCLPIARLCPAPPLASFSASRVLTAPLARKNALSRILFTTQVELVKRLHGDTLDPALAKDLHERRTRLDERIGTLNKFVSAMESGNAGETDVSAAAREAEEAELRKKRVGSCGDYIKQATTLMRRTISGVLTVYLYFMDLISDYNVTRLYYETGAYRFALVSVCLIVGQFGVVWMRVLPYLRTTYGPESLFYRLFLYAGMPIGCFFFDFLMFLGPFGLLTVLPLPESMHLFVPAYGATRMIAEVLVEALPQWIMQAIIFVLVSEHVKMGTAGSVDMALYHYGNGSFVSLMPKSILISSLTMLKTWYDLVQEVHRAQRHPNTTPARFWPPSVLSARGICALLCCRHQP